MTSVEASLLTIISGGQTGVDRAALDHAIAHNLPYAGWATAGGRTEDNIDLLQAYPHLQELTTTDYASRTRRNIDTAGATLIICPPELLATSPGTLLTIDYAEQVNKPHLLSNGHDAPQVTAWLQELPRPLTLNVAGPRATGWPTGYDTTLHLLAASLPHT